jgi:hypothetical protein
MSHDTGGAPNTRLWQARQQSLNATLQVSDNAAGTSNSGPNLLDSGVNVTQAFTGADAMQAPPSVAALGRVGTPRTNAHQSRAANAAGGTGWQLQLQLVERQ